MSNMIVHPALKNVRFTPYGYVARYHRLTFIVTEYTEEDGKKWRHASVSRPNGSLPSYEELVELKRLCIGDDKTALQIFPPKDKHFPGIIGGKEVLHLWCCLDGDITPDFRKKTPWGTMEI